MTERLTRYSSTYNLRCPREKKHPSEEFECRDFQFNLDENAAQKKKCLGAGLGPTVVSHASIKKPRCRSPQVQAVKDVNCLLHHFPPGIAPFDCDIEKAILSDEDEISLKENIKQVVSNSSTVSEDCCIHRDTALQAQEMSKQGLVIPTDDNVKQRYTITDSENNFSEKQFESTGIALTKDEFSSTVENENMKRSDQQSVGGFNEVVCDFFPELKPEDKIECDACHKLLKPGSYRQHLRTHSGAKPFSCELCDATFTRKGDVDRHVRIVHNKQKPFQCPHCVRAFGDKKNLRWHLENHDKRLFYICSVCGFKFGKREYYENHVRFLHPGQSNTQSAIVRPDVKETNQALAFEEVGYVMLVPVKASSETKCLKVPVEKRDHQLSIRSPNLTNEDDLEALVIELKGDEMNSEIFGSDILSDECDIISPPETEAVDYHIKGDSDSFWDNPFGQLSNKWGTNVNDVSPHILEFSPDSPNHQDEESQLCHFLSEEQSAAEENAMMFQLVVDSC